MSRFMLLFVAILLVIAVAFAQDSCTAFDNETVNTILEDCSLDVGTACSSEASDIELSDISAPSVLTLSGSNDANLQVWLVGAAFVSDVSIEEARVRFNARNKAGYNVNLRSGAGTDFAQAGILSFDETAIADGRNADAKWIRIITEQEGIVWVGANFLAVEGDVMSLPVASGNEALNTQEMSFQTSPCAVMPSGLLVIYEGLTPSDVILNGLEMQFTGAVAFITQEEAGLSISVIEGQVRAGIGDDSTLLETGQSVLLDDEPEIQAVDLAIAARLPLTDLLDIPVTCIAELINDAEMHLSPETESETGLSLAAGQYGLVEFQNEDASWWRVTVDAESGWIESDSLAFIGDCDDIDIFTETTAPPSSDTVAVPAANPETVMFNYLQARVAADVGQMQTLSCASWDGQAAIQAQSFRAMRASLENVACSTSSTQDATAIVFCSGNILTEYNGQTRSWDLGSYRMVIENGAWRMCGEA